MRTLQFAPISFDVSFQEIFSTLCSGGTLVLINDAQRRDPKALADFIRRQAINRLFLPFVALQQLAEAADASNLIPGDLREIITAGEQLRMTPSIVNWLARLRDCRLHNHYGPTESHVVTAYTSEYPVGDWSKLPPIGRPIANTQIYILDRLLNPVPIGVSGELHIGGAGLARGYLNRPDLTREKFISNPFKISEGKDEGEKLYQTGDLARFTLNGNIEFLGRMDDQVKIRGFRVELGEIEAVLAQHDHVDETVVLAREDIPGNKRLVAYVVPTQEHVPSVEELRRFLKERLPDYMVPAAFAPLAALPLTPNGKVDRRALAAFDVARQTPEETFVAPRTSVEHRLADIWKSVLWLKLEVGVHDNFFDLGGHSLLSVRLVAEIEKVFNKKLPVAALFQLSTIAELAPRLEEDLDATVSSSDARQPIVQGIANSPLDPEIYRQLLAFTAGWKGQRIAPSALMVGQNTAGTRQPLFWCLQGYRELSQLAKYLGKNQPTYGMRSGHLFMQYSPANVTALAAHYAAEILAVQSEGPYLIGGNCQAARIATEIARQLHGQDRIVTLLCLLDVFRPQPYPGRIALLFGRESKMNPYRRFTSPELGWRKIYSGECSVDHLSGEHGHFFNEPNIQVLAEKVQKCIEHGQQESAAPPISLSWSRPSNLLLPDNSFQAEINTQESCLAAAGENVLLAVNVRNGGSETWPSTDKSGITLGNHWLDIDGNTVKWKDGCVPLPLDLTPGSTARLDLLVTAPDVARALPAGTGSG